jgi:hypothetical protein
VTREGFLQGRVQFGWPRQKLDELFLRLARQPNDLYFGYRFLCGLLGGSDDKIADRTSLDFRGATDDGKRFRCDACLQRAVRLVCCSGIPKLQFDPTRLSSISRAYRGDVETIVAKTLEKDKRRRYASAAVLAADIRDT